MCRFLKCSVPLPPPLCLGRKRSDVENFSPQSVYILPPVSSFFMQLVWTSSGVRQCSALSLPLPSLTHTSVLTCTFSSPFLVFWFFLSDRLREKVLSLFRKDCSKFLFWASGSAGACACRRIAERRVNPSPPPPRPLSPHSCISCLEFPAYPSTTRSATTQHGTLHLKEFYSCTARVASHCSHRPGSRPLYVGSSACVCLWFPCLPQALRTETNKPNDKNVPGLRKAEMTSLLPPLPRTTTQGTPHPHSPFNHLPSY